jgi:transglutaminase-like putative cysteine protease
MEQMEQYLRPTKIIDSHHPDIRAFAENAAGETGDAVEMGVRLYYAVRDGIRYDPYYPFHLPAYYRASTVLRGGRGFCIPKAALLCAAGRAVGIPSRIGFADVRNHLATRQLLEFLGSDIFVFHAFTEFFLAGKWVKATAAFNRELCARHGVEPLEFNGIEDSILQPYTALNKRYMEYLAFHGSFADIPVARIADAFQVAYGHDRVRSWIENYEKYGTIRSNRFDEEDVAIHS